MQKVTAYKAKDGSLHHTAEQARVYQAETEFCQWYENYSLSSLSGEQVDVTDAINWLWRHKNRVLDFLGERDIEVMADKPILTTGE